MHNEEWAAALVRAFADNGVGHFCLAPGSRSAPLALALFALAEEHSSVKVHRHFDERGLGFYAMSLARISESPVVVITTSGTAVANLYPAVIEAWETEVPLIVVSADRPDRLLDCGANQAIGQKGLFAQHNRFSINLTLPDSALAMQDQQMALAAICAASAPSQVNCQFDEPLYPPASANDGAESFVAPVPQLSAADSLAALTACLRRSQRPLVVLGGLSPAQASQLEPWVNRLQTRLVTDITSQFRMGTQPQRLHLFDLCLLNPTFRGLCQPDLIVQLGGRLVSKRLQRWLADSTTPYWLLSDSDKNLDPTGRAQRLRVDYARVDSLLEPGSFNGEAAGRTGQFHQQVAELTAEILNSDSAWSEASASCLTVTRLGSQDALFVGNSLAIRMLDSWLPATAERPAIFSNRGASGIDGLIASCAALAEGRFKQVVAIVGDTSLLHDLNSLSLLRRVSKPIKLIVLNNNGGRIFGLLPAAQQRAFESLFVMPHDLSFAPVARQFGIEYFNAANVQALNQQLDAFFACPASALLECSIPSSRGVDQIKTQMARLQCLTV